MHVTETAEYEATDGGLLWSVWWGVLLVCDVSLLLLSRVSL